MRSNFCWFVILINAVVGGLQFGQKNLFLVQKIGFLYHLIIGLQILRPLFHTNKVYKNCRSATQEAGLLFNLAVTLCHVAHKKGINQ